MIAGTGTGGLIALMLGRLRMSISEVIARYTELSEKIFSDKKERWKDGTFKSSPLEDFIKRLASDYGESRDENLKMLDERPGACKVFVCTMQADDMRGSIPTRFRTYKLPRNQSPNCKVWEAARATTAEPIIFKRIAIQDDVGPSEYIGAGMGCNNPTAHILDEARHAFKDRYVASIISIGTGQARTIALPKPGVKQNVLRTKIAQWLQALATDCERTAQEMASKFETYPDVYFRFNVDQGLQDVELDAWEKIRLVVAHTRQYLLLHDNSVRADKAAIAMRARNNRVSTAVAGAA